MNTTNLNVVESGVSWTIDPLTSDQLNRSAVTNYGTVSDPTAQVYVNGVQAAVDDEGNWEADGVPVNPTGTAELDVQVTDAENNPLNSQNVYQPQPAVVSLMSYIQHGHQNWKNFDLVPYGYPIEYGDSDGTVGWSYTSGGTSDSTGFIWDCSTCSDNSSWNDAETLSAGINGFSASWEEVDSTKEVNERAGGGNDTISQNQATTRVMIVPSGQQTIGQSALYLVMAQVMDEDTGEQLAASAVQFMHQLAGTTTEDVTNADGSVWTEAVVSGPAGAPIEATPIAAGNIDFTGMKTARTKADWQNVVRNEMLFYNGIDIKYYLASNSFLSNRKYIKAVYSFYQKVYLEQPTEYYWAGLAKLAGAPVYAGLSDAQNSGGLLTGFQQGIMQMNIDILNDLAWQFEAYRKGGLNALKVIYAVDNQAIDISSWQEIDQGIQENNQTLILQGNEALLQREQQQVLPPDYTQLSSFETDLMSIFAQCPVWDSDSSQPDYDKPFYLRDFNTVMTSLGYGPHNIAITIDRWTWITTPTYGIWDTWVNLSSDNKSSQVSVDLRTRAATYSTSSLFTLY